MDVPSRTPYHPRVMYFGTLSRAGDCSLQHIVRVVGLHMLAFRPLRPRVSIYVIKPRLVRYIFACRYPMPGSSKLYSINLKESIFELFSIEKLTHTAGTLDNPYTPEFRRISLPLNALEAPGAFGRDRAHRRVPAIRISPRAEGLFNKRSLSYFALGRQGYDHR